VQPSPEPEQVPKTEQVPWDGRDLAITVLGGGGLGLLLSTALLVPLYMSDAVVSPAIQLTLLSLILYGSLCLFGWWFALKRHDASLAAAGFTWVGWGPLLLMIPATIGLIIVTGMLSQALDALFGGVPSAQDQVLAGQNSLTAGDFVWLVIAGAVVAPIAEEFLFRGLLYRFVRARRTVRAAVIISSIVFAVSHFIWVLIPSYLVFGVAEALVAERYKSLYPAMALHALNNGTLFVTLFVVLN
jgi:uncharacterized protein